MHKYSLGTSNVPSAGLKKEEKKRQNKQKDHHYSLSLGVHSPVRGKKTDQ